MVKRSVGTSVILLQPSLNTPRLTLLPQSQNHVPVTHTCHVHKPSSSSPAYNRSSLNVSSVAGSVTMLGSVNICSPSKSSGHKSALKASSLDRKSVSKPSGIPVMALPNSLAKSTCMRPRGSSAPAQKHRVSYWSRYLQTNFLLRTPLKTLIKRVNGIMVSQA